MADNQSRNHANHDTAENPIGHDEAGVAFKTGGGGNFGVGQSGKQPEDTSAQRSEYQSQDGKCKPARN